MSTGKAKIQRLHDGIITGVFIFGTCFLLDMLITSILSHNPFKENLLFYWIGACFLGAVIAQMYLWYYRRGLGRKIK